jgi:hypothetical protein
MLAQLVRQTIRPADGKIGNGASTPSNAIVDGRGGPAKSIVDAPDRFADAADLR